MNENARVHIIGELDLTYEHARRVYDINGVSCAMTCDGVNDVKVLIGGGYDMDINQKIVAMRGRNPENPTSRKSGLPTEQRLELNENDLSNTLTTVQKDNLLQEQIKIRQATEQGYIEMEPGGVADLSYPHSNTRRGRVQDNGTVAPTLTAQNTGIVRIESKYRIRKLTPLECFRLMGCTDEDAQKMLAVNSNSQCYKQAGNSIVVDVMSAMFERLF